MKPRNFPNRKLQRQKRAAGRLEQDTSNFPPSLRHVKSKKRRER